MSSFTAASPVKCIQKRERIRMSDMKKTLVNQNEQNERTEVTREQTKQAQFVATTSNHSRSRKIKSVQAVQAITRDNRLVEQVEREDPSEETLNFKTRCKELTKTREHRTSNVIWKNRISQDTTERKYNE